MPEKNVTNLSYQQINGNYTLRFEIQKVYPKPSCKVISNVSVFFYDYVDCTI